MRTATPMVLGLLLAGCGGEQSADESTGQPAAPDRLDQLFSGRLQVIDLTHALNMTGPHWPSSSGNPFKHEILRAHESGKAAMASYSTPEHHGTHLDAPIHSADGQPTVDELTPMDLFGPAAVIDVADKCAADPDYQLTVHDLRDWEARHGELPLGAIVLMYTGWSHKWENFDAYKNQDSDGQMHFPGFSQQAGEFLVNERVIRGIGIDTLSVDAATSGFGTHRTVNGAGKFHLENVADLHLVPETGAYLIVAPIKIEGGSGGQVRIFAVIP